MPRTHPLLYGGDSLALSDKNDVFPFIGDLPDEDNWQAQRGTPVGIRPSIHV